MRLSPKEWIFYLHAIKGKDLSVVNGIWRLVRISGEHAVKAAEFMRLCFSPPFDFEAGMTAAQIEEYAQSSGLRMYAIKACGSNQWAGIAVIEFAEGELLFHHFGVHPEYRGKGITQFLLECMKCEAQSNGLNRLAFTTYASEKRLIRFYERLGFSLDTKGMVSGMEPVRVRMTVEV